MPTISVETSLTNQVASRHPQSKEWKTWCQRYKKYKGIKGPLSPVSLPSPSHCI